MDDTWTILLEAARRAPSGDNTQPWRYAVDRQSGILRVEAEPARDPSPMNAGGRMSRIALGALVENVVLAARALGLQAEVRSNPTAASLQVRVHGEPSGEADLDSILRDRVTNRRAYDGRSLPAGVLERLRRETPPVDGVHTDWIVDRGTMQGLARAIGRTDALMFGEAAMRRAFLAKVRFDAPAREEVDEGLPLASLEPGPSDVVALRLMRVMPPWLFRVGGAARVFAAKARALVLSSAGLCVVVAPDARPTSDLDVGRAMQRAWLAMTEVGLAVQPMMSPLVLENLRDQGEPAVIASIGAARLEAAILEFRSFLTLQGPDRPAYLMRFGYSSPPSGRTGRRPAAEGLAQGGAAERLSRLGSDKFEGSR